MRLRHRAMLVLALVGISKAPLPQARAQATPADAVASKSAGSAVPTLPDDRLGVRIAPLLLLSRPDVRAEVKLTPDQEAQALAAISDLHGRALATKGMPPDQAKLARKQIDEAQANWVRGHLSAEQLARLTQIDLQWEGPAALATRPFVADSVGLSESQIATIQQAVARRNAARKSATYSKADERALATSVLGLLTDAQKARWKLILGNPFTFHLAASAPTPTTTR